VKPLLMAIAGGSLWFAGGVAINHARYEVLSPLFCMFGGLILDILASKAER
jgi:hypothetical protein